MERAKTEAREGGFPLPFLLFSLSPFLLVFLSVRLVSSTPPDSGTAYAERALQKIGVATDGKGLLAFIRSRTLTDKQRQGLSAQVRALGSADYAEREKASRHLVAQGKVALPYLRPAVDNPDLETSRRARRCIEQIQRSPHPSMVVLAALLIKERRPDGTVPVLLDYVQSVADGSQQDTWLDVLRTVGWREGRADPALVAALKDKHTPLRAAAAHVLGRGSDAAVRRQVQPLLADADARVRFEAAAALARFGDKQAVAVLMALLEDGPFALACQSEYLLRLLAGGQGPQLALDREAADLRRRCRSAWEAWWKKESEQVDLSRLLREVPTRGLTVVCEDEEGGTRVWGCAQGGETCWEIPNLEGAHAVQMLAHDRLLLAEHHANRVTERDRAGKIYWEHPTSGTPISCQRQSNGHTLIATYKDLVEVTRDHRQILRHTDRRGFRDAVRLRNGHVVYITGDGVLVELDAPGEHVLRSVEMGNGAAGAKYRARVEPLLNGRYLLTLGGSDRVIEMDSAGKIHWEYTIRTPMSATRLRNGNTLIASHDERCLIEVDRAGKEVNKQLLKGRPFAARWY